LCCDSYCAEDVSGDQFVDFTDLVMTDNNSYNYVGAVTPLIAKWLAPVKTAIKPPEKPKE
jgi:hypothetical protein